jgi:lipopolysaccharide export system protein LptA
VFFAKRHTRLSKETEYIDLLRERSLMRLLSRLLVCGFVASLFLGVGALPVCAKPAKTASAPVAGPGAAKGGEQMIDVTADQSLEWYQTQRLYVARGNAKAIRGDVTIEADILTAHARETDANKAGAAKEGDGKEGDEAMKQPVAQETAPKKDEKTEAGQGSGGPGGGSIDRLMAEGNVHIIDPKQQVWGDHAVYDFDQHVAKVTGAHLKYMTAKGDVVTARDSMEYYDDQDIAVARGKAKAVRADGKQIDGDVLTAHFETSPQGEKEMSVMTAENNVVVHTTNSSARNAQGDIARGDHAVYDVKKNVAVLTGHVRITRQDTQLAGDKAIVDFTTNESRLVNTGSGRVRALIPSQSADAGSAATQKTAAPASDADKKTAGKGASQ